MIRTRTLLPSLALVAAAAFALPRPAWAQAGVSTGGNPAAMSTPGFGAPGKSKSEAERKEPAPPALPGARAEPDAVAPPTKVSGDMPPNEALFDSINRGDLPGAKEAINRGADLDGKNVLGLTPIELAVDLGRNQISFYLLSLRGGSGYTTASGPAKPQSAAQLKAAERQQAAQARAEAQKAAREEARARSRAVADAAPVAPQTPRLFAGDGGQPLPQAGFLGFGR